MNDSVGFQPLYRQVYNSLTKSISDGDWKPAQSLPSEFALAAELGVSQGTVRKALIQMEADRLVERRQGKGTFVAKHTNEDSSFRFFRLTRRDGTRLMPVAEIESVKRRQAKRQEKNALGLKDKDEVVEICRIRFVDNSPCAAENIVVPYAFFPNIENLDSLGTSLYPLYQREFAISVAKAHEQLRSEVANKKQAKRLNVPTGTALLHVDRIALTIHGQPVEWRSSVMDTRNFSYAVVVN